MPVRRALALFFAVCLVLVLPGSALADGWTPAPDAQGDPTLLGFVDRTEPISGGFQILGWLVDQSNLDAPGIDSVLLYQGVRDAGGTQIAQGQVGQSRPDVASVMGNPRWATAGFVIPVTGWSAPAGTTRLTIYAHSPSKGWWTLAYDYTPLAAAPVPTATQAPSSTPSDAAAQAAHKQELLDAMHWASGIIADANDAFSREDYGRLAQLYNDVKNKQTPPEMKDWMDALRDYLSAASDAIRMINEFPVVTIDGERLDATRSTGEYNRIRRAINDRINDANAARNRANAEAQKLAAVVNSMP
jgi:hypothetical protein